MGIYVKALLILDLENPSFDEFENAIHNLYWECIEKTEHSNDDYSLTAEFCIRISKIYGVVL